MEKRMDYWKEVPNFNTIFHFKWIPFSRGVWFEQLSYSQKQMVNHFEYHNEITTKDCLFKNLLAYSQLNKMNVFDIVPLTFVINMEAQTYNPDFERFVQCYNIIEAAKDPSDNINEEQLLKIINSKLQQITFSKDRRAITHCKAKLHETHFAGKNIWILKPTGFNRGRGVSVFDSMEKLKELLKYYSEGVLETDPMQAPSTNSQVQFSKGENYFPGPSTTISNLNNLPNIIKSNSFVIQKYIEKPLLLHNRKFDVRVWVLVAQDMKVYFFKEGYLRTASELFSLTSESIAKRDVHLTNNAVQQYCKSYGQFEDGNQLSFDQFQVSIFAIF